MSTGILLGYSTQALLGLAAHRCSSCPGIFPSFGLFLPLGFALGPGQAYAIGKRLGGHGLSTAPRPWASPSPPSATSGPASRGIFLINFGIKERLARRRRASHALKDKTILTGVVPRGAEKPVGRAALHRQRSRRLLQLPHRHRRLHLLPELPPPARSHPPPRPHRQDGHGARLQPLGHQLHLLRARGHARPRGHEQGQDQSYVLDDDSLSRTSGLAVDFMLAGAIGAISLVFVGKYWLPIILMSTLCGIMTTILVPWVCSRMFRDHVFERMLMIYGGLHGHPVDRPRPPARDGPRVQDPRRLRLHALRRPHLRPRRALHPVHQPAGKVRPDRRHGTLLDDGRPERYLSGGDPGDVRLPGPPQNPCPGRTDLAPVGSRSPSSIAGRMTCGWGTGSGIRTVPGRTPGDSA
ncbi:MAG: hypothetical protein MZU79_00415 [Anaerotruncus sp.]|nr:hypothetical protein [Anaerotruncus sp.]